MINIYADLEAYSTIEEMDTEGAGELAEREGGREGRAGQGRGWEGRGGEGREGREGNLLVFVLC